MVLVTGGTGFLGSILIRQLLASQEPIRAIKRPSSRIPAELQGVAVQWVDADINDFFALEDAFEGITKVYHCAGKISYHTADRAQLMKVNVAGTANIVALTMERKARLLHVSSIAAVGRAKDGEVTTEEDLWGYSPDQSGYAISKHEAEMEVWRGIAEGLNAVIVNPSVIIGPTAGVTDNGSSGAIFATLHNGLNFYPSGSMGLIDVEDVAKAMILLMESTHIWSERFLLNNANLSSKELLEQCSTHLNRKAPKYRATPFMLSVARRAAGFWALITGKPPLLTRETAEAASQHMCFSNRKVMEATDIQFKPIATTLCEICTTLKTTPH